jgi:ligand-binding sensor domain-containing protein
VTRFDNFLRAETLTKNEGLLSNSVMHVAASEKESFFATSRGLSVMANNRLRGLTSVNGLPSDNVYAAVFYKNAVFVATLGGLAQIENGRVVRTFKDSNSKLTNNWVSALCEARGRLFLGTYGGGVLELTAAGELHSFAGEIGKFAVNPNAMFADAGRLYVGTLGGAFVLDLSSQKWSRLSDELPSKTVLSIAGDDQSVYFGTTSGIARINKNFWLNATKNE